MAGHDGRDGSMMKNQAPAALAGALTLGLLLAGCSGSTEPSAAPTPAAPTSASVTSNAESGGSGDSTGAASDGSGGAVDEVRDGTWQVGDAGEVELAGEGGSLSLTEVRPAAGWQQRIAEEKPSEIEVHFTQGDQEWKFEFEAETGSAGVKIEISQKLRGSMG